MEEEQNETEEDCLALLGKSQLDSETRASLEVEEKEKESGA